MAYRRKYLWKVTVRQLVDRLEDPEDREAMPAGPDGLGSTATYDVRAYRKDGALDIFHSTVAIGCLEDFEITIKRGKAIGQE